MKKLNYINKLLLIGTIVFFSCQETFIPDPIDPRLPKYTQDGRGASGALIDGNKWESISENGLFYSSNPVHIIMNPGQKSISIRFIGNINEEYTSITVDLNQINCKTEKDLLSLTEKKFVLNNGVNSANIEEENKSSYKPSSIPGQIYFRSIRKISENSLIISGTFGFSVISSNGKLTEVTYGRFDYTLWKDKELIITQ